MPTCAYIHKNAVEINPGEGGILACPSCGRTLFKCPNCGETNRPLARYCRACRHAIYFPDAARQMEFALDYEFVGVFPLPPDVGTVRGLKSYGGLAYVIAEAALLVFDLNNLHDLLRRVTLRDERLQDLSISASDKDIELLLTSNRGVYSLSLLDLDLNLSPTRLYGTSGARSIYHAAVSCRGKVHWLEYDSASNTSRLYYAGGERGAAHPGRVHPPIKFDDDRLVIASAEGLALYDVGKDTLSATTPIHEGEPERISMSCQPALDEKSKVLYLASERSLWGVALDDGKLTPQPLQLKPTGDERLAACDDNVFVARSDGFYILDTFGAVKWKADSIFIPEDTSDGFPPQVDGKYCSFSGLKGSGSDIRVYTVSNPNRYSRGIPLEVAPSCAHLFSLGHLLVAAADGSGGQEVRAYKLKESG